MREEDRFESPALRENILHRFEESFLLLGAILVGLMIARPQGLLGRTRVEIV